MSFHLTTRSLRPSLRMATACDTRSLAAPVMRTVIAAALIAAAPLLSSELGGSPGFLAFAAPEGGGNYMGVGSCSSSTCHGSVAPRNASNVLQNEFSTWQKHDPHAKAWKVLLNEDSQRIAHHLGLGAPEKEPMCLVCHSTYVRNERQGSTFQTEDGVGCESCHGPAEKWLGPHTARDATHEKNVSLGLRDLSSPSSQAPLCLSCHFGGDDKYVNHRLIGAGHPRLSFELDTFQAIQPRHWNVDDDYVKRKGGYEPTRAWMTGHLVQAEAMLDRLLSEKRSRMGAFPEFAMFGCASCHHSLTEEQWKRREYGGQPGVPRLNLSSLVILREALAVINPASQRVLGDQIERMHKSFAVGGSAPRDAVASLKKTLSNAVANALPGEPSDDLKRKLLLRMVRFGAETPHLPYEDAEQIAMAASVLANDIAPDGSLYKGEIEALYAALKEPRAFVAEEFTDAAKRFTARIGR